MSNQKAIISDFKKCFHDTGSGGLSFKGKSLQERVSERLWHLLARKMRIAECNNPYKEIVRRLFELYPIMDEYVLNQDSDSFINSTSYIQAPDVIRDFIDEACIYYEDDEDLNNYSVFFYKSKLIGATDDDSAIISEALSSIVFPLKFPFFRGIETTIDGIYYAVTIYESDDTGYMAYSEKILWGIPQLSEQIEKRGMGRGSDKIR